MEPKTKASRVREVLPAIEQKLAEGVRIADILRTLSDGGLELTEGTLKSYLSRHRKRATKAPVFPHRDSASFGRDASRIESFAESRRSAIDMAGPAASASAATPSSDLARPAPLTETSSRVDPRTATGSEGGVQGSSIASSLDAEDEEMAPLASGSVLSVHESLVAARRRVAAIDYSKFVKGKSGRPSR